MRRSLISFSQILRSRTAKVPPEGEKELYQMEKKDYQKGINDNKVKADNPGVKPDRDHKDIAQESVDKKNAEDKRERK